MGTVLDPGAEIRGAGGDLYRIDSLLIAKDIASCYAAQSRGGKVFLKQYNDPSVLFTPWFSAYESYQADIIRRLRGLRQMVVQVLDAFTYNNEYFQAHEWADGMDLQQYVEKRGPLTNPVQFGEALYYAQLFAFELQHVHDAGIIHTDLKPENVYVHHRPGATPLVRLIDFDWAILRDRCTYPWEGGPRGTHFYMSPEHLAGKPVTDKSDIYTTGLIVCKLLTGINPLRQIATKLEYTEDEYPIFFLPLQSARKLPRPSRLAPNLRIPKSIDDLLFDCWHPDPAQRPSSKQFYEVLSKGEHRPVRLLFRQRDNANVFVPFSSEDYRSGRSILSSAYCRMLPGSEYLSRRQADLMPAKDYSKWYIAPPSDGWKPTNATLLNGREVLRVETLTKGDRIQIVDRQTHALCIDLLVDYEDVS